MAESEFEILYAKLKAALIAGEPIDPADIARLNEWRSHDSAH